MVHRIGLLVVFGCAGLAIAMAGPELAAARQAQDMLGPESWSEVLEIRNSRPGRYPAVLHATVFEFDGVLWFYAPIEGTQSLSLKRGRADRDRAALGPLLEALHPGFTAFRPVPRSAGETVPRAEPLPNGCFVESLCELRRRLAAGAPVGDARLLAIYLHVPGVGRIGHTGLLFTTENGRYFWDPDRPATLVPVASEVDPLQIARTLVPAEVAVQSARLWTVSDRELSRPLYADRTGGRRDQPTGGRS